MFKEIVVPGKCSPEFNIMFSNFVLSFDGLLFISVTKSKLHLMEIRDIFLAKI